MSTRCDAHVTIKGGDFQCVEEADHYGLAHRSAEAQTIWGPVPQPPLHRMAPYAAWDEYVTDDEIATIIRGRE